jgi:hypothetical protein
LAELALRVLRPFMDAPEQLIANPQNYYFQGMIILILPAISYWRKLSTQGQR